jgi:pullulanase
MILLTHLNSLEGQIRDYDSYPIYKGTDLGLNYSSRQSSFRIWSPPADNAQLLIYEDGLTDKTSQIIQMKKSDGGTWIATLAGDQKGKFYAFRVHIDNRWSDPVPDPYVKTVGVNGKKGMICDMHDTNPGGWAMDKSPLFRSATDAIIYELHVRDASIGVSSGIKNKGKFLGLTEKGTKNKDGLTTGLDHLKSWG